MNQSRARKIIQQDEASGSDITKILISWGFGKPNDWGKGITYDASYERKMRADAFIKKFEKKGFKISKKIDTTTDAWFTRGAVLTKDGLDIRVIEKSNREGDFQSNGTTIDMDGDYNVLVDIEDSAVKKVKKEKPFQPNLKLANNQILNLKEMKKAKDRLDSGKKMSRNHRIFFGKWDAEEWKEQFASRFAEVSRNILNAEPDSEFTDADFRKLKDFTKVATKLNYAKQPEVKAALLKVRAQLLGIK